MLAAKRLPVILQSTLGDGIDGVCLLTVEGSILSSAFVTDMKLDEIALAAIASSTWNIYAQGGSDIYLHLEKLETGYFGIAAIGKSYLIAGVGRSTPGLLKSRLQQLSQYFSKVFEQIK